MKNFLIATKDVDASTSLARYASNAGYMPHVCHSVAEALSLAQSLRPEIHLIDVMLSDGLGYEVARAIRKHPNLYKTSILITCISGDPHDIEYAMQEGGDDFLPQPITESEFSKKIATWENLRRLNEQRCPITGFPGRLVAMKQELNHLIFRETDFALCYFIPRGLTRLRESHETERVTKVARETSRVIRETITREGFFEVIACHLGSASFAVKTPSEDCKRFCECVAARFSSAYQLGVKKDAILPSPSLHRGSIYSTHSSRFRNAHQMLNELRRMQDMDGTQRIQKPRLT